MSSLAAGYAAVLIGLFYRVGWRRLIAAFKLAARMAGMLLLLISITGAFAWSLTACGISDDMAALVQSLGNSKVLFLLVSVVLLIVLGSVFGGFRRFWCSRRSWSRSRASSASTTCSTASSC